MDHVLLGFFFLSVLLLIALISIIFIFIVVLIRQVCCHFNELFKSEDDVYDLGDPIDKTILSMGDPDAMDPLVV